MSVAKLQSETGALSREVLDLRGLVRKLTEENAEVRRQLGDTRQREKALKEEARRAVREAGRLTGAVVPDLVGGYQIRAARTFEHGGRGYGPGDTVGVIKAAEGMPPDYIADGLRRGLLHATVIPPAKPAPTDGAKGQDDKAAS